MTGKQHQQKKNWLEQNTCIFPPGTLRSLACKCWAHLSGDVAVIVNHNLHWSLMDG